MKIKRNCNNCTNEYLADKRNLKRGWGKCCSKSCAAQLREKSKPGYNEKRVIANNIRRANWNYPVTKLTSEGYRIVDGIAYDEWDNPVYNIDNSN